MKKITYIPSEIANAAIDEYGNRKPVTRTQHIFDDTKGKSQAEVNADVDNSLNQLSDEIDAVNTQDYVPVDTLPAVATADPKKIYRVVGEDSYTDYMVNATGDGWKKLAEYSFPGIDEEPVKDSHNLLESGGAYPFTEIAYTCFNCNGFVDEENNVSTESNITILSLNENIFCYNYENGEVDSKYNVSSNALKKRLDVYEIRKDDEIDDSCLEFFSEEIVLAESIGTLTGFPVAFVHNDIIYVFFDYNIQHNPEPGQEVDDIYYMYSKDGGETWSGIKTITMPASTPETIYEGERIYFSYKYTQPVSFGDRIIALGYMVPTTSQNVCSYRPFFCELSADSDGDLSYSNFHWMPYVEQDGSEITDPVDPGAPGSNIIAGNMLILDGTLYWCFYTSWQNVILLSWEINTYPTKDNINILKVIGDNGAVDGIYRYNEVGMFYARGYINLSIRNENSRNCNYTYDMTTGNCQKVCTTERKCFGPVIYKPADYPAIMVGRQYGFKNPIDISKSRMDNIVILDDFNVPIKENIGFVGHYMGPDSMYCSIVEYEGKLFIFYYYGTTDSNPHPDSHYTLAYKTLQLKFIDTLF